MIKSCSFWAKFTHGFQHRPSKTKTSGRIKQRLEISLPSLRNTDVYLLKLWIQTVKRNFLTTAIYFTNSDCGRDLRFFALNLKPKQTNKKNPTPNKSTKNVSVTCSGKQLLFHSTKREVRFYRQLTRYRLFLIIAALMLQMSYPSDSSCNICQEQRHLLTQNRICLAGP